MNSTVEVGNHFEVRAERFAPSITAINFLGIVCGYQKAPNVFRPLTQWFKKTFNSMALRPGLPVAYRGRVSVRDKTILRVEDARFADEGTTFYCLLSVMNQTTRGIIDILKTVKLQSVYGKYKHFNFCRFWLTFSHT